MKAGPIDDVNVRRVLRPRDTLFTIVISVVALILSGISLFETVLRQPRFSIYAAPRWEYGRGRGNAAEEIIVVPLTISNHGAREGAVLELLLVVTDRAGRSREFESTYVIGQSTAIALDGARTPNAAEIYDLFAPVAVSARASKSASVIFTAGPKGEPLIAAPGMFRARITARTSYDDVYGGFDDALYVPPAPVERCMRLEVFDVALAVQGQNAGLRTSASTNCPN